MAHLITAVESGSAAEKAGLRPGDLLLEMNGQKIIDVFDYRYLMQDDMVELLVERPDEGRLTGEGQFAVRVSKSEWEDLGLSFETGLMDKAKRCANRCIFCFIDQLPGGMRDTLYFKDDDARLSFLQGNYVTLTNMQPRELERILFYHLSPVNISVHTMDADLRRRMLNNPEAGNIKTYLDRFAEAGVSMNFQIVLCKGVNDGEHMIRTVYELAGYHPYACSVSVVPVGLTKHREKLCALSSLTSGDSAEVILQVERMQEEFLKRYGTRFVYAADELYVGAGRPLPGYRAYEDFPQIENGVGMLAMMEREFISALRSAGRTARGVKRRRVSVVTGLCAYDFMKGLIGRLTSKYPLLDVMVYPIVNEFFGELVTVSGLLTGRDIIAQLRGKDLGEALLLPANALRAGDSVFLDDVELCEVSGALGVETRAVTVDGANFFRAIRV